MYLYSQSQVIDLVLLFVGAVGQSLKEKYQDEASAGLGVKCGFSWLVQVGPAGVSYIVL